MKYSYLLAAASVPLILIALALIAGISVVERILGWIGVRTSPSYSYLLLSILLTVCWVFKTKLR